MHTAIVELQNGRSIKLTRDRPITDAWVKEMLAHVAKVEGREVMQQTPACCASTTEPTMAVQEQEQRMQIAICTLIANGWTAAHVDRATEGRYSEDALVLLEREAAMFKAAQ